MGLLALMSISVHVQYWVFSFYSPTGRFETGVGQVNIVSFMTILLPISFFVFGVIVRLGKNDNLKRNSTCNRSRNIGRF